MTSQWVTTEIANALDKKQRNGRRVLFPVSLVPFERVREWKNFNADIGTDAAREIHEYYIPDFTGWGRGPRPLQGGLRQAAEGAEGGGAGRC
jgi:hypothetical protein